MDIGRDNVLQGGRETISKDTLFLKETVADI